VDVDHSIESLSAAAHARQKGPSEKRSSMIHLFSHDLPYYDDYDAGWRFMAGFNA